MFLLPESPFMLLRNYSFLQGMLCFGVEALSVGVVYINVA